MATSLQASGLKLIGVTPDRWVRSTGHCHRAALCSEDSSSTCPHTRAAPVDREHTRASLSYRDPQDDSAKNREHRREV